jgi:hypothetical protein
MRLHFSQALVSLALLFCLCLCLERRAYGYVDPGSGLLILQGIGTVLTGVLFTMRRRIRALFTRSSPVDRTHESTASASEV